MGAESVSVDRKTLGPHLERGDWALPWFPQQCELLVVSQVNMHGGLFPTAQLNAIEYFVKIYELTSCCRSRKLARDWGNGSVEGGHLKVAGGEGRSRARCGWRWREVITPVCAAGG